MGTARSQGLVRLILGLQGLPGSYLSIPGSFLYLKTIWQTFL